MAETREDVDLSATLHEVANALVVVLGWIDRAQSETTLDDARPSLEVAQQRARMAHAMIRHALGAEVETPSSSTRPAAEVVALAALGVEPSMQASGLRFETPMRTPGLDGVLLPRAQSAIQILTNLLMNAASFSPAGGRIDFAVELLESEGASSPMVVFRVADEGPGIPEEHRADLFTSGRTTRRGGAGVGLRHCMKLALEASADLSLAPSSRGATFRLAWPCLERTPDEEPKSTQMREKGTIAGKRILLLEDDAAIVDLLDAMLGVKGAEVVVARDREELETAVKEGVFDAILVDLSPFGRDVEAPLRAMRAHHPKATVVIMSGDATAPMRVPEDIDARWLRKPFEVGDVVAAILE